MRADRSQIWYRVAWGPGCLAGEPVVLHTAICETLVEAMKVGDAGLRVVCQESLRLEGRIDHIIRRVDRASGEEITARLGTWLCERRAVWLRQ